MSKRTIAEHLGTALQIVRESGSALWRLEARLKGAQLGQNVQIVGRPLISVANGSDLVLEDEVRIASALRSNPLGCFQPCVLRTLASTAKLVIGRSAGISGTVICAGLSVEVGEGTIIGSGALIFDNDFHSPSGDWNWETEVRRNARAVKIGRGVFIGARAIILKGVSIGDRAVIGAGSVVTKDVPSGAIAAGNPARIVSSRNSSAARTDVH